MVLPSHETALDAYCVLCGMYVAVRADNKKGRHLCPKHLLMAEMLDKRIQNRVLGMPLESETT